MLPTFHALRLRTPRPYREKKCTAESFRRVAAAVTRRAVPEWYPACQLCAQAARRVPLWQRVRKQRAHANAMRAALVRVTGASRGQYTRSFAARSTGTRHPVQSRMSVPRESQALTAVSAKSANYLNHECGVPSGEETCLCRLQVNAREPRCGRRSVAGAAKSGRRRRLFKV